MRGVNRVMLIGNLGKDPDVQHLDGNIAVAKFPLGRQGHPREDRRRQIAHDQEPRISKH